jgi:hypothetical protein
MPQLAICPRELMKIRTHSDRGAIVFRIRLLTMFKPHRARNVHNSGPASSPDILRPMDISRLNG